MKLPDFLIIGAARSGTTALYRYLGEHPQVYVSRVKEPAFFASEGQNCHFYWADGVDRNGTITTDIREYQALFQGARNGQVIGEASTDYLYNPTQVVPERIKRYVPRAKLIVCLRNPVDRAYSNFLYGIRIGWEPLRDFGQALAEEPSRIQQNWSTFYHYSCKGFYYRQMKPYFEQFDRAQLRVYLYDDWERDNLTILRDLFGFLGVHDQFVPDLSARPNASGIPRSMALHNVERKANRVRRILRVFLPRGLRRNLSSALRAKNLTHPSLHPDLRSRLAAVYRDDVLRLQDLIDRDLTSWLKDTAS